MSDLFDYKKEMSELRFTEIQKKALAEAAASAARAKKPRRPMFRTALIAAVLAQPRGDFHPSVRRGRGPDGGH